MAKQDRIRLQDVVGAILKDVAQSRVLSDIFSRDISYYYEQDDILRTFPVPRMEIKELDMELRFAFDAVGRSDTRKPDTETPEEGDEATTSGLRNTARKRRVQHIFSLYSNIIAQKITEKFIEATETAYKDKKEKDDWKAVVEKLHSDEFQDEFETRLNEFFQWGIAFWVGEREKDFDLDLFLETLNKFIFEGTEQRTDMMSDALEKKHEPIFRATILEPYKVYDIIKKGGQGMRTELDNLVRDMRKRFDFLEEEGQAGDVFVRVTKQDLETIDKDKLSTITIKTTLKNYVWINIGGGARRRLTPE